MSSSPSPPSSPDSQERKSFIYPSPSAASPQSANRTDLSPTGLRGPFQTDRQIQRNPFDYHDVPRLRPSGVAPPPPTSPKISADSATVEEKGPEGREVKERSEDWGDFVTDDEGDVNPPTGQDVSPSPPLDPSIPSANVRPYNFRPSNKQTLVKIGQSVITAKKAEGTLHRTNTDSRFTGVFMMVDGQIQEIERIVEMHCSRSNSVQRNIVPAISEDWICKCKFAGLAFENAKWIPLHEIRQSAVSMATQREFNKMVNEINEETKDGRRLPFLMGALWMGMPEVTKGDRSWHTWRQTVFDPTKHKDVPIVNWHSVRKEVIDWVNEDRLAIMPQPLQLILGIREEDEQTDLETLHERAKTLARKQ